MRAMGNGLELFGMRADGSEVPVSISLSPVVTETQTMIYAGIRDVTERRQQQKEIEALNAKLSHDNAELQTVNRELEAFSYSVSHDLRAPLRHIEGFVEILRSSQSEAMDDEGRRHLQTISESSRQMGKLIDDLLSFSRTTRVELRKVNVSLEELVKSVIHEMGPDTHKRNIEWKTDKLPVVEGDPALLRQVFYNLISNALKYTRTRPQTRIEIGSTKVDDEFVIFIRDNGVGFDPRYAQ